MPKSGFPGCARVARADVVLLKILAVVAFADGEVDAADERAVLAFKFA